MAPAITRWPSWQPLTAEPSFSTTPTGSWPTVRPLATGYSPLRIWTSVPQIVVVAVLINASRGLLVENDAARLDENCGFHFRHWNHLDVALTFCGTTTNALLGERPVVYKTFYVQRHLISRPSHRQFRTAAQNSCVNWDLSVRRLPRRPRSARRSPRIPSRPQDWRAPLPPRWERP